MMLPPTDESKYLNLARWQNYLRAPYLQGESSRTKLFARFAPEVGTWRIDDLRGLHGRDSVIVELDPHQLIDSELDSAGPAVPREAGRCAAVRAMDSRRESATAD